MTSWVDQVVLARKEDAAEIARLRAENARLKGWLRVALDVYDDCDAGDIYDHVNVETFEALRAALKEGGEG